MRSRHSPFSRSLRLLRALAAVALLASVLATGARAEVKAGDAFPDLAAAGLVNVLPDRAPAPLRGKVVLVDFWASWCAPCKASFPALARLHADYAARGLAIVAVSIDEKPAAATAFARKLAPPFGVWLDREQTLVRQVVVPTMPTSYLLGPDGRVRFVHRGFRGEASEREIRQHVEALLAEAK